MDLSTPSRTWTLALGLLAAATPRTGHAQPSIDGVVDAAYGAPLATDPIGDYVGEAAWDLGALYVTHDADHLYIAFSVAGDVGATPHGKYLMYIDTTGDASGATSDPWLRNVAVADPHKPEHAVATWLDAPPYGTSSVELWSYSGAWTNSGTVAAAALSASGGGSVIEWKISRAVLGDPTQVWLEVFSTGENPGDNAQDTITAPADDWNAPSGTGQWSDLATLSCSAGYALTAPAADAGPPDQGVADTAPLPADLAPPPPDAARPDAPAAADLGVVDGSVAAADQQAGADGAIAVDQGGSEDDGATVADARAAQDAGAGSDARPAGDGAPTRRQEEGCGCGASARGSSSAALGLPLLLFALRPPRRRRRTGR